MNKLSLLTLILFLFQFAQISAQNAIMERVQQKITSIEKTTVYQPLEEVKEKADLPLIAKSTLSDKQFFQLNNEAIEQIKTEKNEYLQMTLPIAGKDTELQLVVADIFSDDFRAVSASNPDIELNIDRGQHYWGIVKGAEKSLVAISFFDNQMTGIISLSKAQYVLGKVENNNYHVLYKEKDLKNPREFSCEAIGEYDEVNILTEEKSAKNASDYCIKVHMEVDKSFYNKMGSSISNTTEHINGLFSQVAMVYANEGINLKMSYLNIWETASPYGAGGGAINILRDQGYGQTYGNLVHLVYTGGGGQAHVNVICSNNNNIGVSGLDGNYEELPTLSSDANIIAHELGHNLGSQHTHACVWNGNNTAIDGCWSNTGCEDLPLPSSPGTIMSYCHLYPHVGLDFTAPFHPQPIERMKERIAAATCLEECENIGQTAYPSGTPHNIPGTINATHYDEGGQDIAYNDTSNGNSGSGARQDEDVDTENRASGGNVGWIANGEWLEYTVDVQSSGTYTVAFEVASKNNNGQLKLEFDGDDVTGNVSIPSTGNWGNFTTVTREIALSSGEQIMRVYFTQGGFNLGNITFEADNNEQDCGTENLALEGTASQSTTSNGGGAARAIDGNTSGVWSEGSVTHTKNRSGSWWQVALTGEASISQIKLFNRTDACCVNRLSDFTVSVLDAGGTTVWSKSYDDAPSPSLTINLDEEGSTVKVQLNGTGVLSLAEVQVFGGYCSGFQPDPNKIYYIDSPHQGLRLAASGNSQDAYTTSTNTTGTQVEWKFVDKGNGYWHVQLAQGGLNLPRLRTDNTPNADMQATSSSGSFTYYEFKPGFFANSYYMTLPDGPYDHSRLQIDPEEKVKFVSPDSQGKWVSFTFTEVNGAKVEQTQEVDLYIYPNPFNSQLTVELPLEVESTNMTVQLIDITGKIVYENTQLVTGQILQIDKELPNGFYFLKWSDEQSRMFATRKVIKQ